MAWNRTVVVILGLVLTAGAARAALSPEPVALLVKYRGDVRVERSGAPEPLAGEVGLQLLAGDQLVVPTGGEAVVMYRTGRLVRAAASVTIEDVADAESSGLFANTMKTLGQVATTDARTQPNRQGMIRPIAGAPVPIAPRNEVKVLAVRPTFTWFSAPNATSYMIQIQRLGDDSPRPARYSMGTDTTWTLPLTEAPLVPGATYTWTVGGEGVGRVAEPKRFTVASAADMAALEATLTGLIDAGIDPDQDGLFLTALAYRDAGLYYEALRAVERIAAQGNGNGRAFFMLKGDVLDALGHIDAAEEAFRLAETVPAG
jgi:hypothetical protein